MTSSLHHNSRRRAFTLVELLVVIGLVVLLMAIAIPMISRAHRASIRTAMASDLAIIANGLEAYKADFGDYPRRTVTDINGRTLTGASVLCWALVAPGPASSSGTIAGDGADGPGFRTRGVTGAVKGPYLPVDRFIIGEYITPMSPAPKTAVQMTGTQYTVAPTSAPDDAVDMLADRNSRPILYYPANKASDPYSAAVSGGGYIGGPLATFNFADNDEAASPGGDSMLGIDQKPNKLSKDVMCFRLGALGDNGGKPDGTMRQPQVPITTGPYLLWSPGPDGYFGTADDVANAGSDIQLNTARVPSSYTDPNPELQ